MGQETAGFLLSKVPCKTRWTEVRQLHAAWGWLFSSHLTGREEDHITKSGLSYRSEQRCQAVSPANVWCHFPGTQHFVGAGSMAFCPLKSLPNTAAVAPGAVQRKRHATASASAWASWRFNWAHFPSAAERLFSLLKQGTLFSCDCCIYFTSCTRNVVWHSLGRSRLWFTVVINIPKYTCKLNDTLIL